jgi:diguanylate cyclase (GGDEF)-like protein
MLNDANPTSMPEAGRPIIRVPTRLRSMGALALVLVGIVLLLVITWVDYITGTEISFSIFYLLPTSLVTWRLGRGAGLVLSLLSSVAWFLADTLSGQTYTHSAIPVWNALVRLGFFLVTVLVLAAFRDALLREKSLARRDFLTGLINGHYFRQLLGEELARSRRYSHSLSLAYIDLDNFKSINDRLGHAAGDTVLKEVGELLLANSRSTDTPARLAGDEFAVLMPETGNDVAVVAVKRLHDQLRDLMQSHGRNVTSSIGLVTYMAAPDSGESALKAADALMYAAKNQGKNRIVTRIEPGMSHRRLENAKMKQ